MNLFRVDGGSEGVAEEQEVSAVLFLIGGKDTMIAGRRDADQSLQVFVVFLKCLDINRQISYWLDDNMNSLFSCKKNWQNT